MFDKNDSAEKSRSSEVPTIFNKLSNIESVDESRPSEVLNVIEERPSEVPSEQVQNQEDEDVNEEE
jgi:hypothetical protein